MKLRTTGTGKKAAFIAGALAFWALIVAVIVMWNFASASHAGAIGAQGVPSPAPTVVPPPGVVAIGFDYDGPPPSIHSYPGEFDHGGMATVSLVVLGPPNEVADLTAQLEYDTVVAELVDCIPHFPATCEVNPAEGEISVTVNVPEGLPEAVTLVDLTFSDTTDDPSKLPCSPLDLGAWPVTDTEGQPVELLVMPAGTLCFINNLPTPSPGPTPDPAGSMDAMSIDFDVNGNTATSLGPQDACVEVDPGETVTLDVTAEGIPASNPMLAFSFTLGFSALAFTVTSGDPFYLLAVNPGSNILNVNDVVPGTSGEWSGAAADLAPAEVPSEYGSGVLERLTLTVDASAAPGNYPVTLVQGFNQHVDTSGMGHEPDALHGGFVAVDAQCGGPGPSATGTPTPVPTNPPATPTATPNPDGPLVATIGFDHDGAPANINAGPGMTPALSTASVALVADVASGSVSNWEMLVVYDSARFRLASCEAGFGGSCAALDSNVVRVSGSGQVAGTAVIATLTFDNVQAGCSTLTAEVLVLEPANGTEGNVSGRSGIVCTSQGAAQAAAAVAPAALPAAGGEPAPLPTSGGTQGGPAEIVVELFAALGLIAVGSGVTSASWLTYKRKPPE